MSLNRLNSYLNRCIRCQLINPQLLLQRFSTITCTATSSSLPIDICISTTAVAASPVNLLLQSSKIRKQNQIPIVRSIQSLPNPALSVKKSSSTTDQARSTPTHPVGQAANLIYRQCCYSSSSASRSMDEKDYNETPKKEADAKKSKWWSKESWTGKNSWKGGLLALALTFASSGGAVIFSWGEPQRDEDGEIIKDKYSNDPAVVAYTLRAWNDMKAFFQMVRAPTSEKLLPDVLVPPYVQPPYTVVLELSGLLLKPEWDLKMGWRFKKRPGLDYFLQVCAQSGYEIVIFSHEPASVAFPLTISMDPQQFIWYRLFKEDTRYTSGVHIKDLNCLNRDLAKVILVDVKKESYQLNPRNGIAVNCWDGDADDRELYDVASFLQTIATNKVEDIRSVVQHYNQFDDPMAKFRENQAAVLKTQAEMEKLQAEDVKKSLGPKNSFISPGFRKK